MTDNFQEIEFSHCFGCEESTTHELVNIEPKPNERVYTYECSVCNRKKKYTAELSDIEKGKVENF